MSPTEFEGQSQKRLRLARGAKSPSASAWGWAALRAGWLHPARFGELRRSVAKARPHAQ